MKKKFLIVFFLVLMIFFTSNHNSIFNEVNADSGFDSSWDSGGNDWGGDWDSDWDSNRDNHYYSTSPPSPLAIILLLILLIFGLYVFKKYGIKSTHNSNSLVILNLAHINEISDSEVSKYLKDFNKKQFLQDRFNDYLQIQNAWMNFDYDLLQSKLTDEIYNQYVMQLETLKIKNQKNIMSDFSYLDSMITSIKEENNQITLTLELITSFYDYLEQNGKVVRGNKNKKITMHYEITFVCNLKGENKKCPNCGAKLSKNASSKCEYCGSVISNVSSNWAMSKKEAKRQG